MATTNHKIQYSLEAAVSGQQDVASLARQLEGLSETLEGDLKVQAQASAQALRELGAKQGAIDNFVNLKQQAAESAARLREAQAAAQQFGQSIAASGAPTRAQVGQMEKLRDAVRSAKVELQSNATQLEKARSALQGYGISTSDVAGKQVHVNKALAAARNEIQRMAPAYNAAAQAATRSGAQQVAAADRTSGSLESLGDQLRTVQSIAMAAVGGTFVTRMAGDVAATADEFKNLEARVKLATGEGENFERSFAGVQRVALETNSALDETGTLFARLTKASQEGGMAAEAAQQRALGLTTTINQSIQLSGGSAESAKAAITQLIQGLQSGVLRGEEFNSVMEQAPRLTQAMANGLGVTTGKLREMAKEGELTAEVVMRALEGQADAVAAEFAKLPETVGRALQNLSSAWTLYVGQQDRGLISTENAAKLINTLATNLDTLVTTLEMVGKVWAAMKIASLAGQFANWASETIAATTATAANTVAVAANTTALKANALAAGAAAKAQGAAAVAQTAAGAAATRSTAFATAAAGVFGRLGGTATTTAGAMTRAGGALGMVGGALRGAGAAASKFIGFLGGPVGAIASTALFWGEIKQLGTWLGETAAKMVGYRDRSKEVALADAAAAASAKKLADERLRQGEGEKKAKQEASDRAKSLTGDAKAMVSEYQKLRKEGKDTADALGEIAKKADLGSAVGTREFGAALRELKLDAEGLRTAFGAALKDSDLEGFSARAKAAFGSAKQDAGLLASALDAGLREAVRQSGADFDVLSGGMSDASQKAIASTDTIIDGMGRLKSQGVDVGAALKASLGAAINTADSQAAVDALGGKIEKVRAVLGEKLANSLLEQLRKQADEAGLSLEKIPAMAKDVAERTREAFKSMGIQMKGEMQNTAFEFAREYELIKNSGQATAEDLARAWQRWAEASIKANGGVASESMRTEAATHGLEVAIDSAGKTVVRRMGEATQSTEGYRQSIQGATQDVQKYVGWLDRMKERNDRVGKLPPAGRVGRNGEELGEGVTEIGSGGQYRNREGFASDAKGNTIAMGGDLTTLTGVAAFLKAAGIEDEATARRIAREFSDGKGNIPYFSNPGQMKYGGDTISAALLKAAERVTFGGYGVGGAKVPGIDTSIPKQAPREVNVNLNVNGKSFVVPTNERGVTNIIDAISAAKQSAGG